MCNPYIESATALSDIHIYMDTNTDHFTPLVLRLRGNKYIYITEKPFTSN